MASLQILLWCAASLFGASFVPRSHRACRGTSGHPPVVSPLLVPSYGLALLPCRARGPLASPPCPGRSSCLACGSWLKALALPMSTVAHIMAMAHGSMWPSSRMCSPSSFLIWSPVTTSTSPAVRYTEVPVILPVTTAVAMPAAMSDGMVIIILPSSGRLICKVVFLFCCREKVNWPVSSSGSPMGTTGCTRPESSLVLARLRSLC
jgi:hypothetical protein